MANTNYPSANEPQNRPTKQAQNSRVKNIAIGILAAGLLGTWAYFLKTKNESDSKIATTQAQASTAMTTRDSVQLLYNDALTRLDTITGKNNQLQNQVNQGNSEISNLKKEIATVLSKKNATQSELSRAKSLIGTLNNKIASLEQEVARLNGENQQLAATNTQLNSEKQVLQTNLQTTTSQKEELAKTVDVASTFSASNIAITPYHEKKNGKEKETTSYKRVDKLDVSFDVENRVARSGPADLYVIVTAPDGKVVSSTELGSATLTTRTDGERPYTTKQSIDYQQGTRMPVKFSIKQDKFEQGDYKIEIYQNGFKVAEGTRTLKKGGLFG